MATEVSSNWQQLRQQLEAAKNSNSAKSKSKKKRNKKKKATNIAATGSASNNAQVATTSTSKKAVAVAKSTTEHHMTVKQSVSNSKMTTIHKGQNQSVQQQQQKQGQGNQQQKTKECKVLALDCEYVGVGFEGREDMLARASIVDGEGHVVFDKYVRPDEPVTDYRTAVSGIRPGHLRRGEPFVQIQQEMHKLLADNIVVGHALHNDFRVLGFKHPSRLIRDTAKHRPFREMIKAMNGGTEAKGTPSLKLLVHYLLGVQIQQGEHDSVTDARMALRLYQTHRKRWEAERGMKQKRKSKAGTIRKKTAMNENDRKLD